MNKTILFFVVCYFVVYGCFSQTLIDKDKESYTSLIEEKFNQAFQEKTSLKKLKKEDKYVEKLIKKGLDVQIGIIDFLASKFSVQSMENFLSDIKKNKKIEKIANYLFEQINYSKNKIEKELKKK